jgi:hypothetical protein
MHVFVMPLLIFIVETISIVISNRKFKSILLLISNDATLNETTLSPNHDSFLNQQQSITI